MTPISALHRRIAVCLGLLLLAAAPQAVGGSTHLYLPIISRNVICQPLPPQTYLILSADPPGPTLPAAIHPDHNLALRGYELTDEDCELVDYGGRPDPSAPQLAGLFGAPRLPRFVSTYRVHDWDWPQMQRGPLLTRPPVTALGLESAPGETLHVPQSGYTIGSDCAVLVIFATSDQITLKYTREDNVVYGYTLHVDHICVDPALLALYQACDRARRTYLPALHPGQAFGRARDRQVIVAIVDSGTFMDPRSHADWWRLTNHE